jgi:hypothetical protein
VLSGALIERYPGFFVQPTGRHGEAVKWAALILTQDGEVQDPAAVQLLASGTRTSDRFRPQTPLAERHLVGGTGDVQPKVSTNAHIAEADRRLALLLWGSVEAM